MGPRRTACLPLPCTSLGSAGTSLWACHDCSFLFKCLACYCMLVPVQGLTP